MCVCVCVLGGVNSACENGESGGVGLYRGGGR